MQVRQHRSRPDRPTEYHPEISRRPTCCRTCDSAGAVIATTADTIVHSPGKGYHRKPSACCRYRSHLIRSRWASSPGYSTCYQHL